MKSVPYIVDLVGGLNNSPEGLTHGFTDMFMVTFRNEANRTYYVYEEPVHQAFKKMVGPLLNNGADGVLVFDFFESGYPGINFNATKSFFE
jgi:hypothetical protein